MITNFRVLPLMVQRLRFLIGLVVLWGTLTPAPGQDVSNRQEILLSQRLAKKEDLKPEQLSKAERMLHRYEEHPWLQKLTIKGYHGFRLLIGGLPSGSGFAFGGGYTTHPDNRDYRFTFSTLYSTRDFRQVEARLDVPVKSRRRPFNTYVLARYSDYKNLNFFGLGPESAENDRSTFRSEERRLGWGLSYTPNRFFDFDGSASLFNVGVGGGSQELSIDERFDTSTLAGFANNSEFFLYSGAASIQLLDSDFPGAGVVVRLGVDRFDDRDAEQYHFTRLSGELQAHIPLGVRSRMLAARLRTSHSLADAGEEVPFYLQETLGGARTLRGFQEYRYRDIRNLLLNLEYRWEVWPYAQLAFFGDAGKVFRNAGDLDFTDLQGSFGFGVRVALPGGSRLRLDLAKSNEGIRFHIGSGPAF